MMIGEYSRSDWDRLAEIEPLAKAAYRTAVENGETGSRMSRFHRAMLDLATEHPEAGLDRRWDLLKGKFPQLFWKFVLMFAGGTE
jgi:hypothetical protein